MIKFLELFWFMGNKVYTGYSCERDPLTKKGFYDDIHNGYIQRVSIPIGESNMACLKSISAVSSGVFRLTFIDCDG